MARVLWRDAQGKEGALDLGAGEARVGRAMDCAIRTDDAMVSRHHARLFWSGSGYVLEDLGSANGIYYQEQRVMQHHFKHGDAVRCGSLWLRFVDADAAHQPSPQPPPQQQAPAPRPQPPPPAPPPSHAIPQPVPQAPQSQPMRAQAPPPSAGREEDAEEIRRLRRRIEQLQTELRVLRGGGKGQKMEDLENEIHQLKAERDQIQEAKEELETKLESERGDVRAARADQMIQKAGQTVAQLNDLLSNLRINVMAAEGEFEQFAGDLPKASFELIREALRSSSSDVDNARELLRELRDLD